MSELGPTYSVELLERLPVADGMWQALPCREELKDVAKRFGRTAAAYEVVLQHYHEAKAENDRLQTELTAARRAVKAWDVVASMVSIGIVHADGAYFVSAARGQGHGQGSGWNVDPITAVLAADEALRAMEGGK